MPLRSTTYVREDGTEGRAQVVSRRGGLGRRSTLRDRIARLHLETIDPDLRSSFDRLGAKVYARTEEKAVHVGLDLSNAADFSTIWIYRP